MRIGFKSNLDLSATSPSTLTHDFGDGEKPEFQWCCFISVYPHQWKAKCQNISYC